MEDHLHCETLPNDIEVYRKHLYYESLLLEVF